MDCPQNASELCMFISCVNFYHYIWSNHALILKPLTDRLKKHAPILLTPDMQAAFNKIHALLTTDALAANPDHKKRFDVYADSFDYQLGACSVQED
ncbi:LOW QUALITY PROTEIN: hypothetical protein ACHAW6_005746 [Cyclotella cf. meneghiniana]